MKLSFATFLAALSISIVLVESGHHRVHHETLGKSSKGQPLSAIDLEYSMAYTEIEVSVVYTGKAHKKSGKSDKGEPTMAKSEKDEYIMSMMESEMSNGYLGDSAKLVGKATKTHTEMAKSEKHYLMSYLETGLSHTYTSKAEKVVIGKAEKLMDKAGKMGKTEEYLAYEDKTEESAHSMSIAMTDDSSDADGEWVLITTAPPETIINTIDGTTGATLPTVADLTTELPTQSTETQSTFPGVVTTISDIQATESAMGFVTSPSESTVFPLKTTFNEELFEEEVAILKNGHGSDSHTHSKEEDSIEVSNKMASGNHLRPDALTSPGRSSLSAYRLSIVAVCVTGFLYALSS
ncbi:hypothetical protein ACHAW6_010450 [Cyclotella cf. meneghiniana]